MVLYVNASLHLVDDVKVGDYILIHTGFALQKISEEEALETIRIIRELEQEMPVVKYLDEYRDKELVNTLVSCHPAQDPGER